MKPQTIASGDDDQEACDLLRQAIELQQKLLGDSAHKGVVAQQTNQEVARLMTEAYKSLQELDDDFLATLLKGVGKDDSASD